MSLEGYTGPTSGRITIGGGDNPEIKRESFTQAQDPILTRDERNATEWFRALPPNEQYREVRRMKWNLEEQRREIEALRDTFLRQEKEIRQLRAELATRRPDGFEIPRAANEILTLAKIYGWNTAKAWVPVTFTDDEGDLIKDHTRFRFEIAFAKDGYSFQLSWSVPRDGRGRGSMIRRGLARYPRRDWHDAPSLTKIKKIIRGAEDV
jgi:hypothetical protein